MLSPNLEILAAVEPDLVIAWSGSDVSAVRRVVERGHGRVRTTSVDRLRDMGYVVGQVGAWIGEEESADRLRLEIGEALELAARGGGIADAPTILWVVWTEPIVVVGPDTFLHDLIEVVGGRNAAGRIGAAWPQLGWESLIQLDPDVLIWPDGPGMFPASDLGDRSRWKMLRAVREGRVLTVDSKSFHVPGPNIARSAVELARSLGGLLRR